MSKTNEKASQSLLKSKTYKDTLSKIAMKDADNGFNTVQTLEKEVKENPYIAAGILQELSIRMEVNPEIKFCKQDIQAIKESPAVKESDFSKISEEHLGYALDKIINDFKDANYQLNFEKKQQSYTTPQYNIDFNNKWTNYAATIYGETFNVFDDNSIGKALENPVLTISASVCAQNLKNQGLKVPSFEELIGNPSVQTFAVEKLSSYKDAPDEIEKANQNPQDVFKNMGLTSTEEFEKSHPQKQEPLSLSEIMWQNYFNSRSTK